MDSMCIYTNQGPFKAKFKFIIFTREMHILIFMINNYYTMALQFV